MIKLNGNFLRMFQACNIICCNHSCFHSSPSKSYYDMLRLSWSIQVEILLKWFFTSWESSEITHEMIRSLGLTFGMLLWKYGMSWIMSCFCVVDWLIKHNSFRYWDQGPRTWKYKAKKHNNPTVRQPGVAEVWSFISFHEQQADVFLHFSYVEKTSESGGFSCQTWCVQTHRSSCIGCYLGQSIWTWTYIVYTNIFGSLSSMFQVGLI